MYEDWTAEMVEHRADRDDYMGAARESTRADVRRYWVQRARAENHSYIACRVEARAALARLN